jgi:FixJ family two-component response regulator
MPYEPALYIVEQNSPARLVLPQSESLGGLKVEVFDSAQAFWSKYGADCQRLRGCLLLDLQLGLNEGMDLQQRLAEAAAHLPVVVMSATADVNTAVRTMKRGAVDFLQKPVDLERVCAAVQEALARDAANEQRRQSRRQVAERIARLSAREREVMDLVVEGLANKQIAARLGLSGKTVEAHRGRVMRKTEADSIAGLVKLALGVTPTASHNGSVHLEKC